jgi:hypothetical protein
MKKYLLGIVAIVLAISFSAFTSLQDRPLLEQKYFKYLDYPNDAFVSVASHYELSSDLGCTSGAHRCAVIANSAGGSPEVPDLSDPSIQIKDKD